MEGELNRFMKLNVTTAFNIGFKMLSQWLRPIKLMVNILIKQGHGKGCYMDKTSGTTHETTV